MDLVAFRALALLFFGQQKNMIKDKDVEISVFRACSLLLERALHDQLAVFGEKIKLLYRSKEEKKKRRDKNKNKKRVRDLSKGS